MKSLGVPPVNGTNSGAIAPLSAAIAPLSAAIAALSVEQHSEIPGADADIVSKLAETVAPAAAGAPEVVVNPPNPSPTLPSVKTEKIMKVFFFF